MLTESALGKRIIEIRKIRMLSQKQLAERMGVKQQSYHKMEHHPDHTTRFYLGKVAAALEVPEFFLYMEHLAINKTNLDFVCGLSAKQKMIRESYEKHTLLTGHIIAELQRISQVAQTELQHLQLKFEGK